MMYDVICNAGLRHVQHVSLPGYRTRPGGLALALEEPLWLLPPDWGGKSARWIIMVRRPDRTAASMMRRGMAPSIEEGIEMWNRAIVMLSEVPNALWVSYEAFVAFPDRQWATIARWLGVRARHLEGIYDANAKYVT